MYYHFLNKRDLLKKFAKINNHSANSEEKNYTYFKRCVNVVANLLTLVGSKSGIVNNSYINLIRAM